MKKIVIPQWLRDESPICADFCELINYALEEKPNMSLQEFAEDLNNSNLELSYERIQQAEARQFSGVEKHQ